VAQVIPVRQCDAKTLRLVIRTVTMEFLDLTPFSSAVLTLYSDPFDPASIIGNWSTDDPRYHTCGLGRADKVGNRAP